MTEPIKLTYADHVLIHAVAALLADPDWCDKDAMIQSILRDVLRDATQENPAMTAWIAIAWTLVKAPTGTLRGLRLDRTKVLRDFHMRRMAAAWDQIREGYGHADNPA